MEPLKQRIQNRRIDHTKHDVYIRFQIYSCKVFLGNNLNTTRNAHTDIEHGKKKDHYPKLFR